MYGSIRKTTDGYEATYERLLRHPPEKVWQALTDPAHIKQWFVRTEIDPRVGGRIVEHHDHVGLSMAGEITRFDPPKTFEHTWWGEGPKDQPDSRVLWEIHREGEGSRLVMTYWLRSLEGVTGQMAGWHICLDVLEAVLDGTDPDLHGPPKGTFADGELHVETPGTGLWADREALDTHYDAVVAALKDKER